MSSKSFHLIGLLTLAQTLGYACAVDETDDADGQAGGSSGGAAAGAGGMDPGSGGAGLGGVSAADSGMAGADASAGGAAMGGEDGGIGGAEAGGGSGVGGATGGAAGTAGSAGGTAGAAGGRGGSAGAGAAGSGGSAGAAAAGGTAGAAGSGGGTAGAAGSSGGSAGAAGGATGAGGASGGSAGAGGTSGAAGAGGGAGGGGGVCSSHLAGCNDADPSTTGEVCMSGVCTAPETSRATLECDLIGACPCSSIVDHNGMTNVHDDALIYLDVHSDSCGGVDGAVLYSVGTGALTEIDDGAVPAGGAIGGSGTRVNGWFPLGVGPNGYFTGRLDPNPTRVSWDATGQDPRVIALDFGALHGRTSLTHYNEFSADDVYTWYLGESATVADRMVLVRCLLGGSCADTTYDEAFPIGQFVLSTTMGTFPVRRRYAGHLLAYNDLATGDLVVIQDATGQDLVFETTTARQAGLSAGLLRWDTRSTSPPFDRQRMNILFFGAHELLLCSLGLPLSNDTTFSCHSVPVPAPTRLNYIAGDIDVSAPGEPKVFIATDCLEPAGCAGPVNYFLVTQRGNVDTPATWQEIPLGSTPDAMPEAVVFTNSGRIVATGRDGNEIRIWEW